MTWMSLIRLLVILIIYWWTLLYIIAHWLATCMFLLKVSFKGALIYTDAP